VWDRVGYRLVVLADIDHDRRNPLDAQATTFFALFVAHQRHWPRDHGRIVEQVFAEEQVRLGSKKVPQHNY
jgi:hypothetical protein